MVLLDISYVLQGPPQPLSSWLQIHHLLHQRTHHPHLMAQELHQAYTKHGVKYQTHPQYFYLLPVLGPGVFGISLQLCIFLSSLLFYPLGFRSLQSLLVDSSGYLFLKENVKTVDGKLYKVR